MLPSKQDRIVYRQFHRTGWITGDLVDTQSNRFIYYKRQTYQKSVFQCAESSSQFFMESGLYGGNLRTSVEVTSEFKAGTFHLFLALIAHQANEASWTETEVNSTLN